MGVVVKGGIAAFVRDEDLDPSVLPTLSMRMVLKSAFGAVESALFFTPGCLGWMGMASLIFIVALSALLGYPV
jgi:hypothetical protein